MNLLELLYPFVLTIGLFAVGYGIWIIYDITNELNNKKSIK